MEPMSHSDLIALLGRVRPKTEGYVTDYSPNALEKEMKDGMEGVGGDPPDWDWSFALMSPWEIEMGVEYPALPKDVKKLRRLMQKGTPLPPITVMKGESYEWYGDVEISNGRHRLQAAREEGINRVPVLVVEA